MTKFQSRWTRSVAAAALTLGMAGFAVAPAAAQGKKDKKEAAAPKQSVSKAFMPHAQKAQKALEAKDFATVDAAIAEGASSASEPYDKYLLGFFTLQSGLAAADEAKQARGVEAMVESGGAPAAELPKFQFFAGQFAYKAKDYAKAARYFGAARASGYAQPSLPAMYIDALFKANQASTALTETEALIAAETAAGRRPSETLYVAPAQHFQAAGNKAEMINWIIRRAAAYPDAKVWNSTIMLYLQNTTNDKDMTLDALRLLRAANAMSKRVEYVEYAALASELGLPGETVSLIDAGRTAGTVAKTDSFFNDIYGRQQPQIAADRGALARDEASAKTAANGVRARSTGDALLSYGEYARAAAMYELALSKGGVDANVVRTRLGMVQAMQGNPAAIATLDAVTGPRKQLANLWKAWAQRGSALPAATAAAPAG